MHNVHVIQKGLYAKKNTSVHRLPAFAKIVCFVSPHAACNSIVLQL